jgi:serpin B
MRASPQLIVSALLLMAVLAFPTGADAFSRGPDPMTPARAGEAGNDFAWDLFGQLKSREGNLFFSPTSIDLALVMTWAGARGATAKDMGDVLHLNPDHAGRPGLVTGAYGGLQQAIMAADQPFTLRVANRLWGQAGFGFRPEFLELLARDFEAGLQEVDFVGDSEGARKTINAWVAERTEDKIQDLLAAGSLGADVRLVLTNAIYFLGQWQNPFQGADTRDRPFFLTSSEQAPVPTMAQSGEFAYAEDGLVQVLTLPYQEGLAEMVIILPREKDGLAGLEGSLDRPLLDGWLQQRQDRRVHVQLPRFTLEDDFSLARVLGQMGMASAFGPRADFSGMAAGPDLFISDVVHKSFIDVYEKGTEAAAATAVTIRLTSMPMNPENEVRFVADHPFVFLIRHVPTGQILFLGRLTDPRS